MFDHVEIKVGDFKKSKKFYESALKPLGVALFFEIENMAGFGTGKILGADAKPRVEFLIEGKSPITPHIHVAFKAKSKKEVDAFYKEGLASGGKDNGAPGIREDYHPGYYSAFLFDPDGHNVEVVYHGT